MKIVILDDTRKSRTALTDALSKKKKDVADCFSSNEFINAIEKGKIDLILMDMESWTKGRSIYNYFSIAKKLEDVPVLFYNAAPNFSVLEDRPRHAKDQILFKPTETVAVITCVQDSF
ncbi:MAG: response regulator [Chitinispirillaceae bacterium]|jgi:DNA-binding NtrC family response regulator|nr:response regulator [Chitinispirillaceae bacterium]